MKSSLELCASALATELSQMNLFDIAEVTALISIRMKNAVKDFIQDHATSSEKEYLELLQKQKNLKQGSPEYNKTAYELTFAKHKKAVANRALNNVKKDDYLSLLKRHIIQKLGGNFISDFETKYNLCA